MRKGRRGGTDRKRNVLNIIGIMRQNRTNLGDATIQVSWVTATAAVMGSDNTVFLQFCYRAKPRLAHSVDPACEDGSY